MTMLTTLKDAASHFEDHLLELRDSSNAVLIVGVGGPTAVGKSTLTRMFLRVGAAHAVKVRALEGDRWLIPQYRREPGASFPEGVYDLDTLRAAVADLDAGRPFSAPFYEREGRSTGRIAVRGVQSANRIPAEVEARCRDLQAKVTSRLGVDAATGDVYEEIQPAGELWILDSELALFDPALKSYLDLSYAIRASRQTRMRHFLHAVSQGERYGRLSEDDAEEKLEGFFETDDRLIEPTVEGADHIIELSEDGILG